MRVLIVCQGLEKNRILASISVHAPNKVVILRNTKDVSKKLAIDVQKHVDGVKKALKQKRVYPFVFEVAEKKVDFFDVVGAFSELDSFIKKEQAEEHEVFADISSGSKTVVMALFLACQVNKVPVSYCKAAQYLPSKGDAIVSMAKEPVFIPPMPIQIEKLAWGVLEVLPAESLSQILKKMGRPVNKSELLSLSRSIDRLAEFGYVETKRVGKKKEVKITSAGKQLAKMAK